MANELTVITSRSLMYDEACRVIATLHDIDEVKDFHDKAAALQEYARQAKNYDLEKQAYEVRKRAERQAGIILIVMLEEGKRRAYGDRIGFPIIDDDNKNVVDNVTKTLSELGITPNQSMQWQRLAQLEAAKFEEAIAESVVGERPNPSVINLAVGRNRERFSSGESITAHTNAKLAIGKADRELQALIEQCETGVVIDEAAFDILEQSMMWLNRTYSKLHGMRSTSMRKGVSNV